MSLEHNPIRSGRRFRPPEAAEYIGLAESTLAKMRVRGDGPAYFKVGGRAVFYDVTDIEQWLASRKRRSTSDCGEGDE